MWWSKKKQTYGRIFSKRKAWPRPLTFILIFFISQPYEECRKWNVLIPADTISKKGAKSPQTRENWMQPEACLICPPSVSFQIKLSWCSVRSHQMSQQGTCNVAECLFLKYIITSHGKMTSMRWEFIWNTGGYFFMWQWRAPGFFFCFVLFS